MGANSTQAVAVTLFLLAFTALPLGVASGKLVFYLLSVALLAISIALFRKCKPLEHAEN
ncbi:MAG TPA: hypothetical protein VII25_12360 [Candidatus Acidoferrum sp.]